jgi:hypothetical protein
MDVVRAGGGILSGCIGAMFMGIFGWKIFLCAFAPLCLISTKIREKNYGSHLEILSRGRV